MPIARYFGAAWRLNETRLLPLLERSFARVAEAEEQWLALDQLALMWRMRVADMRSVALAPEPVHLLALLDDRYVPRLWVTLSAHALELNFKVQPDLHGLPRAERTRLSPEYLAGLVPVRLGPLPLRRNASHAVALALSGTRVELTFDGVLRLVHEVPARLAFHVELTRARLAHWLLVVGNHEVIGGSWAAGPDVELHLHKRNSRAPQLVCPGLAPNCTVNLHTAELECFKGSCSVYFVYLKNLSRVCINA